MVIMTIRGWLATLFMAIFPSVFLVPGCGGEDDIGGTLYGPPTCTTDEECVEMMGGEGWICSDDEMCIQAGDGDVQADSDLGDSAQAEEEEPYSTEYGPQTCQTDEDCNSMMNEEGWLCDTDTGECYLPEGDQDEESAS